METAPGPALQRRRWHHGRLNEPPGLAAIRRWIRKPRPKLHGAWLWILWIRDRLQECRKWMSERGGPALRRAGRQISRVGRLALDAARLLQAVRHTARRGSGLAPEWSRRGGRATRASGRSDEAAELIGKLAGRLGRTATRTIGIGQDLRRTGRILDFGDGWRRLRKQRAKTRPVSYRQFTFDVVMANPPFAGKIKQSDLLSSYELAHKTTGKMETQVGRDLLFIERNLDFLRPGGRMAIVLPQGRFNNGTDQRVRDFIMRNCRVLAVVDLHPNTFKPHTGTRTSVLFVQKWNDDPDAGPLCHKVDDYRIFFATQKKESVNSRGEKVYLRGDEGLLLRDAHGHFIVAHDLFNHDGRTRDGIAEAFKEFAVEEGVSFFPPAPSTVAA